MDKTHQTGNAGGFQRIPHIQMLRLIKQVVLPSLLGVFMAQGHCALLDEIQLRGHSFGSSDHSVSADGQVFGVAKQEGGKTFIGAHGRSLELAAIPDDTTGTMPIKKHDERVVVNPDGKYVLNFLRGEVVIRSLPDSEIAWRGQLENVHAPYSALAYHFNSAAKQLRAVFYDQLTTFSLVGDGPAKRLSGTSISFVPDGHSPWGNFVQSAAFSANGQTLFVGNMDGEVLAADLRSDTPTLRWRAAVFDKIKAGRFNDDASRYASQIACANNCQTLLAHAFREHQVALIDASTGRLLAKQTGDETFRVVSLGNGMLMQSIASADRRTQSHAIVDLGLQPVQGLRNVNDTVAFGFMGGFASVASVGSGKGWVMRFTDVSGLLEERRRAIEEDQRRQAQFQKQLPEFRRKLRSGDDSHCGLVVERKGEIALIETAIGQKWLKVSQLHQPGARSCRIVNGMLQD
jgi:hypothetical protein